MPRSALASWPEMFHETVVCEFSSACSKVTVPLMLESPRRTATGNFKLANRSLRMSGSFRLSPNRAAARRSVKEPSGCVGSGELIGASGTLTSSEARALVLNMVLRQLAEHSIGPLAASRGPEKVARRHNVLNPAQPLPHLAATRQASAVKGNAHTSLDHFGGFIYLVIRLGWIEA